MRRLEGKNILVIGSGGIGGELASRYAQEGGQVVLGDIDVDGAKAVVQEVNKAGGRALATRLDGTDEASIEAAVSLASETFGGIDGVHVNYATFADEGRKGEDVLDLPLEDFDKTIDVNLRGYFLCTRKTLPALLRRGGGAIIYTSSAGAYAGGPTRVAYAISKLGIHALMRHVATRFGKRNVRANVVCPGVVMHEGWERLGEEFKEQAISAGRLSRLGAPSDIAAMSALLMADEGSFVTGQVISVDGGLTMRP